MTIVSLHPTPAPRHGTGRHRRPRRRLSHRLLPVLLAVAALALSCAASAAGRAGPAPPPGPGPLHRLEPRYDWPLEPAPPPLVRPFEQPAHPYGPGHRGVDLGAEPGQRVLAVEQGFVVFAGPVAGRGVVSIDHDGGLRSTYEPLEPTVSAGDQVYAGQVIGTVEAGHPGCTAVACLHWGVRRGEEYLNPVYLVEPAGRLRLKPWEG
ncbi:murein hydrolase activator EnvC family protein [Amycolatopsis aidingensis]|uniref:murein hydrolase activator EnvC family protein n=1 Tax=Amycolatopsis aidingensis TaxID=2842453 RepID=UPI001C0CCCF8|nr:M23 family metallopeptidase [Amycolatopsis aidingensis]